MRGLDRFARSRGHPLARACAAVLLAATLGGQVAGADTGPATTVDEPVAVADAVSVVPPADTASADGVTLADSASVTPPGTASTDEPVGLGDSVAIVPSVNASSAEPVGVGDAVSVVPPASAASDEPLGLADSVSIVPPAQPAAGESVAVLDQAAIEPSPVVTAADAATVTDAAEIEALLSPTATAAAAGREPLLLGAAEPITVAVTTNGAPATAGSVTIAEHGVAVAGPLPVDASGHVSFAVTGLGLGAHDLDVRFAGSPLLVPSHTSLRVDVYDYSLELSPAQATVQRGSALDLTLTAPLTPGSATGGSNMVLPLTVAPLPGGVTGTLGGVLTLPALGTTTLHLSTTPSATPGDAVVTVNGDDGARAATAHVYVNAPPVADAGGPYTAREGSRVPVTVVVTDPDADRQTAAWDLDGDGTFETAGFTATVDAVDGPATLPIRVRVCDDHDACTVAAATVNVENVAPTARIVAPTDGTIVEARTPVAFTSAFADPGVRDTQSFAWSFGATTQNATYAFPSAGFPTVRLTVTDKDGGVGTASVSLVVVDPAAGFVTGGGWIPSAAGKSAFEVTARATGTRTIGSVALAARNAVFVSTSLRYLVVVGRTATIEGDGVVNGAAGYRFRFVGSDGPPDKVSLRVWSAATGAVVYDAPLTALGGGQFKIHS